MRTCLVTGGAGFIGSHLVEALLARGDRVLVLDDLSTGSVDNLRTVLEHPRLNLILDSLANTERLYQLLDQADIVFHLAAVVGVQRVLQAPELTAEVNVGPTEMILNYLTTRPRPCFLASTSEVYGKNPKTPLNEDDDLILGPPTKYRWIYACSKAMDEYLALAAHQRHGLPVVIGRFFNVVGPRQTGRYGMVLPRFVDQALSGGPLVVHDDGRQVRCFAHVADVVDGVLGLMHCPTAMGRVFNLGSDQPVTIRQLAETVARVVNPALEIQHVSYERAYGPGFEDIRHRVPDLTRVRQATGYQSRHTLEQIVREVVASKRNAVFSPYT